MCTFANMFCLDSLVKAKLNILGCQYLLVNFCGMLDQYLNLLVKFYYQAMAASYVFSFILVVAIALPFVLLLRIYFSACIISANCLVQFTFQVVAFRIRI